MDPAAVVADLEVSIHASRFQEAMPSDSSSLPNKSRSFNPRLPFPGGDAKDSYNAEMARAVSIHASRFQEAMLISRNYRKHQNKKPVLREPLYS